MQSNRLWLINKSNNNKVINRWSHESQITVMRFSDFYWYICLNCIYLCVGHNKHTEDVALVSTNLWWVITPRSEVEKLGGPASCDSCHMQPAALYPHHTYKHSLLLPAGHITNTLGNRALTHNQPLTSHTVQEERKTHYWKQYFCSRFPFFFLLYIFLFPTHTSYCIQKLYDTHLKHFFLKKEHVRYLLWPHAWSPVVELYHDPLRRTPEASVTEETYQWAIKSPQWHPLGSRWMSSHLLK